jgi:hypothetical protein
MHIKIKLNHKNLQINLEDESLKSLKIKNSSN